MTIEFVTGDIFESGCQAVVNTVNCEGKMGKGLAFQFKKRFPEMEKEYIEICKRGELYPGLLHFYQEKEIIIINFPTKNKWREKSKMEYIIKGLKRLKEEIVQRKIKSIAIPPLGAGNGGLNWNDVKNELELELSNMNDVAFKVYEPSQKVKKDVREPKANIDTLLLSYIGYKLTNANSKNLKLTVELLSILTQGKINIINLKSILKDMNEIRDFYSLESYKDMYQLINNKLISKNTESKKSSWNYVDEAVRLIENYPAEIDGVIEVLHNVEHKSNRNIEIEKNIKEIMLKENLIEYNIFEEIEIIYYT